MSKFVQANGKIAEKVVKGCMKIEGSIVDGFGRVTDACVKTLFAGDGESAEDAMARLSDKAEE